MDLAGQILIAMPGMADPRFERSVVLICAHSDEGAMGLIVNKPLEELSFSGLLEHLNIPLGPKGRDIRVHFGGPGKALLALGYSGWGPGQLEAEIARNDWLTCDAPEGVVFGSEDGGKWSAALRGMGIDPLTLSAAAGRA